ncbi:hypothetical protein CASFOL_012308 [Castilleja foliolosa]|uniref:MYB transcription factor n=1 Tax=Castilleja foliolosa TaxID=1961234 RepID=A0ABD3DQ10_9LAMI
MGNPKQKWTAEEEEALRAGVAKHGAGKWKIVHRDPEFNHLLYYRSNIDLKDKWRNLSVASGQCIRIISKTSKVKTNSADTPATPQPFAQTSASVVTPSSQDASTGVVMLDSLRSLPEGNISSKYNAMIFEALSTLNGPDGLESAAIANFIEQRQEVPPNFRRQLSSRLRRLVQQDKLEKVQNYYKIKTDKQVETKVSTTTTIHKDPQRARPLVVQSIGCLRDTVEEAAVCAAYKVAESENKSFVAAESVREAERVSAMAEEMESLLQFAMYCYDQSACGKILLFA